MSIKFLDKNRDCIYKRILVVYPETYSKYNPFVKLLVDKLKKYYIIKVGINALYDKNYSYDIIHFHWPEAVFYWTQPGEKELEELNKIISFRKEKGSKIIYTRHNIKPHSDRYLNNKNQLYSIIEKNSDYIIHLGNWSRNEYIRNNTKKTSHAIIYHHIYNMFESPWITKERARDYFNISYDKLVVLAFGDFRNEEEKEWTLRAFNSIEHDDKLLIAPRFGKILPSTIHDARHYWLHNKFVDDEELAYYFTVADIVFIQRTDILNSGNLPMAFLFNKFVVGPDIGNVGEILQKTNNFTFVPGNVNSVQKAFKEAIHQIYHGNCKNHNYAIRHWSIKRIANQYKKIFNQLTNL